MKICLLNHNIAPYPAVWLGGRATAWHSVESQCILSRWIESRLGHACYSISLDCDMTLCSSCQRYRGRGDALWSHLDKWISITCNIKHSFFYNYPHSFGIASCVGTASMVTWRLHLTRPCCVDIVIPSVDLNMGLRVSVYLNLTHALNRCATTAGI